MEEATFEVRFSIKMDFELSPKRVVSVTSVSSLHKRASCYSVCVNIFLQLILAFRAAAKPNTSVTLREQR